MRRAIIAALVLAAAAARPDTRTSPLTRGLADALYLKLGGGTVAGTLTVNNLTINGTCTGCSTGSVPTTRTISTTSPLGGGGALSSNLTLTCTTCATSANDLSFFSSTTSAQLIALLSNETGTGSAVFGTSPTLTTPFIGDFTNATHAHTSNATGGALGASSITSGTLPTARGGTNADSSASSGVPLVTAGTWSFAAGIANLAASTSANLRSVLSDENGTGVAIFNGATSLGIGSTSPPGSSLLYLLGSDGAVATPPTLAAKDFLVIENNGNANGVFICGSSSACGWKWFKSADGSTPDGQFNYNMSTDIMSFNASANTTRMSISSTGLKLDDQALTSGTMTATNSALARSVVSRYDWTNAMVTALPTTAGDIAVATLPAKTVLVNAYVVITGAATGPTTVTVAVGRTSATYIDYIVASDAKAAANTVYGDASAERGTNLTGYDVPSFTGTTVVNAHFVSTVANLSTTTGSTGSVYLVTEKLP